MLLMNDFTREPEVLVRAQVEAFERVLRSGWYILGPEVAAFERFWADYCGVAHAIGVANGMDALEIGLRCLDVGPGDEVITTPVTAFATVLSIIRAGAEPVLADIEPDTGRMDASSVRRCLSERTRAILPVHLYGGLADIRALRTICDDHGLALAEDCCQAHGARVGGRSVGTFGDFAAWSFYPTKNLGTVGDGGCITTKNETLAAAARVLRDYGRIGRYSHSHVGLNSRLDEVHAAILGERMKHLQGFNAARSAVAERYTCGIRNPAVELLRAPGSDETPVHHLFPVLVDQRARFMAHMAELGVQTLVHYPIPAHLQDPCRNARRDPCGLGNAERFSERVVSIPCHPFLATEEVERVVEAVNAFR